MTRLTPRQWIADRVPIPYEWLHKPLREELPVHLRAWVLWFGGTPLVLFCVQVVTGVLLTFYYTPDTSHAWDSVRRITFDLRFGWLVRGMHQTGAQLMIIAVMLHTIRVFATRAYRAPRELNWVFGVGLFLLTLAFGFTGYSLVYDSLSYWATTVGTNLLGSLPLVGPRLLYLLRGGLDVNPNTLARSFDLHIGVIPMLFVVLVLGHILLLRLHGVAKLDGDTRTATYPFFPDHVVREAAIGFILLLALVVHSMVSPPGLGPPADPSVTPAHIRPEWYFFPSYHWLKMVPSAVGIWTSAAFVLVMVLWPWVDAGLERLVPGRRLGVWLGSAAFLFTLVLLLLEALS
jgi:quinol-cytochrome oxidoreductase complex cytochrome b subunit